MQHLERALDNQNQWWKYLIMFLAGFIGASLVGTIPLMVVIFIKSTQNGSEIGNISENPLDFSGYGIDPNAGLVLMLIPFVFGLITVWLLAKPLHKRNIREIINGTNTIRWNKFFFAAAVWGFIMGSYLIISYNFNPDNFKVNFNISSLIPLVIISVLLIPLQTTFEETLFRGYLAQGVAAWTKSRWWAIIIPSIVFALLHMSNPEVKEYGFWMAMPQYLIFGFVFGLISILDDGIETAMGAHAINNVFASVFITTEASAIQTSALLEELNVDPARDTRTLIAFSLLFVLILAYYYKWDFSVLNKKVE